MTSLPAADRPPRPRRWIPLSLRMFVGFLAALGVCRVAWLGIRIWQYDATIAQIERAGGMVDRVTGAPTEMRLSNWPESWVSPSLEHATQVRLVDSRIADAGLKAVGTLSDVRYVNLRDTAISDKGMAYLSGLTKLVFLNLENTQVTDAGIVQLGGLARLRVLILRHTRVTDAGVAELKRALPGLMIER